MIESKLEGIDQDQFTLTTSALMMLLNAIELEEELETQRIASFGEWTPEDLDAFKVKYDVLTKNTNLFLENTQDQEQLKKENLDGTLRIAGYKCCFVFTRTPIIYK
ncbi:hypothetical protein J2T13_004597 [Paenibacillus sp. DS2015]|uniref:hypothetical protein n=1 Tax=Paenibacillus sp. DS2015 TaxID=3373917 RepID=UPI003D23BC38